MLETSRRYWLLEKHTLTVKNQSGDTVTIHLHPGECITLTRTDPPPDRWTDEVTDDQG